MKLYSSDFENGGEIPEKFSCVGAGVRPSLSWSELPLKAKSLAISLTDPDAPSGNFIHWLVLNIPVSASGIGSTEAIGNELLNSAGKTEYIPPCPPSGKHHYIFTLYALKTDRIDPATITDFYQLIKPEVVDQAKISGLFGKG